MGFVVLFEGKKDFSNGYVLVDIKTDTLSDMLAAVDSLDKDVQWDSYFIYECDISADDITQEQFEDMYCTQFQSGKKHSFFTDVRSGYVHMLTFNPDTHCYRCHKCGGVLAGNMKTQHTMCNCISGWIRPDYRPVPQ